MERARSEGENGGVKLPIGFRFHPTDEELLLHYLKRKVLCLPLPATVIPELEAFHFNPWDLPGELKEKRYFFCKRKRNLMNKCSTDCGYWKSSGKGKQIVGAETNNVIGMKKSFVFYQDRKSKTQWIMQEFSLVGFLKTPLLNQRVAMQVGDWVVCRLFQRKRRPRNHSNNSKNELGVSIAQTTSCSSGITHISCSDLDQEASSRSATFL
ncbi:NAC domain-containing protein 83-like [Salvia miltiorrhiza]|uniref:NAC domain-containing protein 83-like n=1 Tax=Salvia miltiorrhiza TaxID=226208 RepID=UPI0025AD33CE|nr:NAC domain-containing protein 83-like [Salvia miltiorrhiza]